MANACIIDAVRTPRRIGEVRERTLSALHPQHVAATVLKAPNARDKPDIGATGVVLIGTALDERDRSDGRLARVATCPAGGAAPAIVVERI